MAFTFLKKVHNISIGNSLFDEEGYKSIDYLMNKAKSKGVQIYLPVDFICAREISNEVEYRTFNLKSGIPDGWIGLDSGPYTTEINKAVIE